MHAPVGQAGEGKMPPTVTALFEKEALNLVHQ